MTRFCFTPIENVPALGISLIKESDWLGKCSLLIQLEVSLLKKGSVCSRYQLA